MTSHQCYGLCYTEQWDPGVRTLGSSHLAAQLLLHQLRDQSQAEGGDRVYLLLAFILHSGIAVNKQCYGI